MTTPSTPHRFALALTFLVAFAAFTAGMEASASAQTASVEVRVILGSNNGTGVDAALAPLQGQLTRQFSQFSGFRQHSVRSFNLSVGQTESVSLPGGGAATIELRGVSNGEQELRIGVPGGGTTMRTRGGLFFVGGARVGSDTLILAIQT